MSGREDDAGRLLTDCDLKDKQGQRIAKIAKNTPVFVADGYRARIIPGEPSEVIRTVDEQVVSRIERLGLAEHELGLAAGRYLPLVREGDVGRRRSDGV